jgi:amphi-Trp domain-containing protein
MSRQLAFWSAGCGVVLQSRKVTAIGVSPGRLDSRPPCADQLLDQEHPMTEDRDIDVSHDLASFVSELRRLADALENSTEFTIHIDGEEVTIPEGAKFSVSHERESGEIELEFQVTWSVDLEDDEDEDDEDEDEDDDLEDDEDEDEDEPVEDTEDQTVDAKAASETALV